MAVSIEIDYSTEIEDLRAEQKYFSARNVTSSDVVSGHQEGPGFPNCQVASNSKAELQPSLRQKKNGSSTGHIGGSLETAKARSSRAAASCAGPSTRSRALTGKPKKSTHSHKT